MPSKKAEPCPLAGAVIEVPGSVFSTPEENYTATVVGWNNGSTQSVTVKFADDGRKYWFPVEDVEKWITAPPPELAAGAEAPAAARPKARTPEASPAGRARLALPSRQRAASSSASPQGTPVSPRGLRRRAVAEAGRAAPGGAEAPASPLGRKGLRERAAPAPGAGPAAAAGKPAPAAPAPQATGAQQYPPYVMLASRIAMALLAASMLLGSLGGSLWLWWVGGADGTD